MILAIDPGSEVSALIHWDGEKIVSAEIVGNLAALTVCRSGRCPVYIEGMGFQNKMAGMEVIETAVWIGRFHQAALCGERNSQIVKRREIVKFHTGIGTNGDAQVRAALIDKYGPPYTTEMHAPMGKRGKPLKERKRRVPGLTFPLTGHLWQAFALATMVTEGGLEERAS